MCNPTKRSKLLEVLEDDPPASSPDRLPAFKTSRGESIQELLKKEKPVMVAGTAAPLTTKGVPARPGAGSAATKGVLSLKVPGMG